MLTDSTDEENLPCFLLLEDVEVKSLCMLGNLELKLLKKTLNQRNLASDIYKNRFLNVINDLSTCLFLYIVFQLK